MNAVLDVHAAVDSTDCDWPGCDREAERGSRCRYHVGRTPNGQQVDDSAGRIVPGALAHLMHDDPEPDQEAQPMTQPIFLCRVGGCGRQSVAQAGPWKGWCGDHKLEEMKRRAKKRYAKKGEASAAAEPVKPPPDEKTQPKASGTLTALAQAVDQAQADLDTATARHHDALQALRDALDGA